MQVNYKPIRLKSKSSIAVCHSDISIIQNDWNLRYNPVVPGHEVIGSLPNSAAKQKKGLKIGQRVGIGWTAESCQHCDPCIEWTKYNVLERYATIVGHAGGFADGKSVRAGNGLFRFQMISIQPVLALYSCGGITKFDLILQHQIRPFTMLP